MQVPRKSRSNLFLRSQDMLLWQILFMRCCLWRQGMFKMQASRLLQVHNGRQEMLLQPKMHLWVGMRLQGVFP